MEGKIVLVAGNGDQARRWVRENVIMVSHPEELVNRLRGIKIGEVHFIGTYYGWFTSREEDYLKILVELRKKDEKFTL